MTWARMRRLRFTGQFGPGGATSRSLSPNCVCRRVSPRFASMTAHSPMPSAPRIGADMNATFDVAAEALAIARRFGRQLSGLLWVPTFALYDVLRADSSKFLYWMGARQS